MLKLVLLPALVLSADPKWEKATETQGVTVMRREREGSAIKEVRATGVFNAPAADVFAIINDLDNYTRFMPYTAEVKVLEREANDKKVLCYQRLTAPLVAERDYLIYIEEEGTSTDNGKTGTLKVRWTSAPKEKDKLMPERKDVVRVRINDGYWELQGNADGTKTFGTYYVYSSPGGEVPTFLVNIANTEAVPKLFGSIRQELARRAKKSP